MIRPTLAPVLFASVLSFASLAACGGNHAAPESPASPAAHDAHDAATTPAAKGVMKEPGDAKVGDTSRCPVSGEEFTVEASSPKVEHEGKTYYFCCSGCKKKFEADPAKFMKKS